VGGDPLRARVTLGLAAVFLYASYALFAVTAGKVVLVDLATLPTTRPELEG
jgi:hypothetical protein